MGSLPVKVFGVWVREKGLDRWVFDVISVRVQLGSGNPCLGALTLTFDSMIVLGFSDMRHV